MGCSNSPKLSENNRPDRTNIEEVETIVNKGNNELNQGIKLEIKDNYKQHIIIKENLEEVDEGKKRIKEEKEKKRKEEEEKRIKEEKEKRIKEEKEKKRKEEEEKKRKEEEEKRIKEEEEKKRKEEEESEKKLFKEKEEKLKKEYEDLLKKETEERNKLENDSIRWSEYEKLKVDYHSISEIRERILDSLKNKDKTIKYSTEPKKKYPYKLGKISKETLDNTIKYFNCLRYIAGIPYDVGISKEYQEIAEAASLLMSINNLLAHSGQPKPNKMDNKLFKLGDKGCNSCNLGMGYHNLIDSINGWISDSGCFDSMGHRRWVLYPPMKNTGFGFVNGSCSMYCFDKTFVDSEYKNVAWPAQNTPIEAFKDNDIWTVSLGKQIDCDDIEVNLKDNNNGKILKFSKNYNKNRFLVLNNNYGQTGCIAFHPDLYYQDGDFFRVDIKGTGVAISYDVKFFSARCIHETELIDNINPTCIKKGNQTFYCKICNIKINKEIDMIPHDYEYNIINKNSGKCEGKCNFCEKIINFIAPTNIEFYWRNNETTEDAYYYSNIPKLNPIGSIIECNISEINGDKNLLGLPDQIEEYSNLTVLKEGYVTLIIYPKYNPELKYTFSFHLG